MTLIAHEWRQNGKTLFIWSAVVAGMTFVFMLMLPQIAGQVNMVSDIFANMGGFSAAFGMDKINVATPMGFYGVEAGAVISVGGGMLAALLGGAILCKEEGGHTAEFLLTAPVRREWVALQKLAALAGMITVFNLMCALAGLAGFAAIGEAPEWDNFLLYHAAQLCMQLEIGCVCFGISAFLKKTSLGFSIGVSLLFYFLHLMANVGGQADWLRYVTPYAYADAGSIFPEGAVRWGLALLGGGYAAAAVLAAVIKYGRKDMEA